MIGNGSSRLRWRGINHQQQQQLLNLTSTRPARLRIPIICCRCSPADFTAHFALLGRIPFASKFDVKQAYKRLALKYHPDVYKGGDVSAGKDKAFREIKSTYECLIEKFEG